MPSTSLRILAAAVGVAIAATVAEIFVLQPIHITAVFGTLLAGNALTAAVCLALARRRSPAPQAEAAPPLWSEPAHHDTSELAPLADHLFVMIDSGVDDGDEADWRETSFVRLDDLRWLLGQYVLRGGRLQRLLTVPTVSTAAELRPAARELSFAIRHTNEVVSDWLLAHRVALPDPDVLDTNALFDRYRRAEIEPLTVSGDPLYLLTCYIHDILETADSMGDPAHSALDGLEAALRRPLTALEAELAALTAFEALVSRV